MASKCLINGLHAWLGKKGIYKMICKGRTVFLDEDYQNLHPGVVLNGLFGDLEKYTEQNPCPATGDTISYNQLSYKRTENGTTTTKINGYLKSSNKDGVTVSRNGVGDYYTGSMVIAANTTPFLRKALIRSDNADGDGAMGMYTVYQTGDPQGQLLIYDADSDTSSLSNVTTADMSRSSTLYTLAASTAKNFYMYAYKDGRNIEFSAPSNGSVLLIKTTNTTNIDVQELLDNITNSIGSISPSSSWKTEGDVQYVRTSSAAVARLAPNQVLYVQYIPSTSGTCRFETLPYQAEDVPTGPTQQLITNYVFTHGLTGSLDDDYSFETSLDNKQYIIGYLDDAMNTGSDTMVPLSMTFTNTTSSSIEMHADIIYPPVGYNFDLKINGFVYTRDMTATQIIPLPAHSDMTIEFTPDTTQSVQYDSSKLKIVLTAGKYS